MNALIEAAKARREANGLKLTVVYDDGGEFVCYAKDVEQLNKWKSNFEAKIGKLNMIGISIIEVK